MSSSGAVVRASGMTKQGGPARLELQQPIQWSQRDVVWGW